MPDPEFKDAGAVRVTALPIERSSLFVMIVPARDTVPDPDWVKAPSEESVSSAEVVKTPEFVIVIGPVADVVALPRNEICPCEADTRCSSGDDIISESCCACSGELCERSCVHRTRGDVISAIDRQARERNSTCSSGYCNAAGTGGERQGSGTI